MHERCPRRPLCAAVVRCSAMSYISLVERAIATLALSRRLLPLLLLRRSRRPAVATYLIYLYLSSRVP
eukprot:scaffold22960_cov58-Phaeocystis_antarctica.AAC.4